MAWNARLTHESRIGNYVEGNAHGRIEPNCKDIVVDDDPAGSRTSVFRMPLHQTAVIWTDGQKVWLNVQAEVHLEFL